MIRIMDFLRYAAILCAIGIVISGSIAIADGEIEIPSIPLAIGFDF
jgi:hypothetical protein